MLEYDSDSTIVESYCCNSKSGGVMARIWRSVIVVGLCFAAVVAMRIYLNRQIELSKAQSSGDHIDAGSVATE